MHRILPVGLLLLTLLPQTARAGDVVEGENLRIIYDDSNGLWWGTGTDSDGATVNGGIQMNVGGTWQDFMSSNDLWVFWGFEYEQPAGNPWEYYGGYGDRGSGAGLYNDWTVASTGNMSSDTTAQHYAQLIVGDIVVDKTETWDLSSQTAYVQMVLTNTSTSTDIENLRFMAAFNPYDRYNASTQTVNDTQDLDGDGVLDWTQSAGNASGATKRYTVGFYICDVDNQSVGHAGDDYDVDQTLTDFGGLRVNGTMHIFNQTELIAAGDSVVVSFLVATGATDSQARVNAQSGTGDCTTCDTDADAYENELCQGVDCDDHDDSIFPGAADSWYDGVDANCGDDDDFDADGDGHVPDEYAGQTTDGVASSGALPADDCLDTNPSVYLGAPEIWYDGLDADCGSEDDFDQDGDGYVPTAYYAETTVNVAGSGRLPGNDCDDENGLINPVADEAWYDGVDQDCDGADDYDQDGDGYAAEGYSALSGLPGGDCDDLDAEVSPGETEDWYDGVDADCDGADDYDQDGDGQVLAIYAGEATSGVAGSGLLPATDCDDEDVRRYAGATEIWYDGLDADCGGEDDYDQDGDGFVFDAYEGLLTEGVPGSGLLPGGECDDDVTAINPDATELWYDGIDQDCDGNDEDQDSDGWIYTLDCVDTDASINPGALDVPYDGVDTDCSGNNDYDADNDGYAPDAYTSISGLPGGDCDDNNATTYPGASETWYDGVDSDCGGEDDYDADGDGHAEPGFGGVSGLPDDDCDDTDPNVYPGATEIWYDGLDSDCDSESDWDQDGDGHDDDGYDKDGDGVIDIDPDGDDCDDNDGAVSPSAEEVCYDGVDTNCEPTDEYDCDQDGHDIAYDRNGDGVVDNADEDPDGNDCDDENSEVNPGAEEVCYDGTDLDCVSENEYDCDSDGHDAAGYDKDGDGSIDPDPDGDDCDDANSAVSPSADEICYDGVDENCDFQNDFDCDLDSHISDQYGGDDCQDDDPTKWDECGVDDDDDGYEACDEDNDADCDCDDNDASVNPGVAEICGDAVDQNCDPTDDCDCDADGVPSVDCGGSDYCDDNADSVCDENGEKDLGYFRGGGGCSGEGCGGEADSGAAAALLFGAAALARRRRRST